MYGVADFLPAGGTVVSRQAPGVFLNHRAIREP
jgi:hypothetical protein